MSLSDIISKIKFSPARKKSEEENGGRLYGLWLLLLPLVLGFSAGRIADAGIGYLLDVLSGSGGMIDEAVTDIQTEANSVSKSRGLEAFLSSNPFKISPQKTDTPAPEPPKPKDDTPKEADNTALDEIILRGTHPGIGAWFDIKNELKLILVGKNIDSYKLTAVSYKDVLLRRGNEKPVRKFIVYGPTAPVKKAEAPKPPAPAPSKPAPAPAGQAGNIVAAVPGSQEGQVPGELVTNLVQNPFDELKRIRIRPNEKAGGLEVQWIQNDSLLKRLGVQRGDVIRSVNGVPFTNMGDIANSINSLMTSERFDVEVTRGGQNTALRYVVK